MNPWTLKTFLIEYVWDLNDVEHNRSCDLPVNSENGGPSFSTGNCFPFLNIQNSGTPKCHGKSLARQILRLDVWRLFLRKV